ncbi:hypothetical protein [Nitrosomonas sp.]|uniref:hypothetical protein n=1 Tax=Nitrosomonas sp. TaxID=42353 RepID=UPI00284CABC6|nr:hypothetical protein [Nitrosomonas sp.]MDR4515035.1 hypothetical protein [Nitrosomonas sp.]
MNSKDDCVILKAYLKDFQERVQLPKLKRLNYIVDSRMEKAAQQKHFATLGIDKNIQEKIAKKDISKSKILEQYRSGRERGVLPEYIASTKDSCQRFREEIRLRSNMFHGKPVMEFNLLFRQVLTTQNRKTLKNLPKVDELLGDKKKSSLERAWGWAEEGPFQAWLDAQNTWFQGDEEEVNLYSGYDFIPAHSEYRYFIKWDGKGWYAALAEPMYGLTGRVRMKIQLNTYFIQSPYPGVITVRKVPWTILDIDSTNIKESNFIGGYEFFETSVSFKPESIVLITQEMQLYVYSMNYAFGLLDFRGWEDDPYWVNFGLFGIPKEG